MKEEILNTYQIGKKEKYIYISDMIINTLIGSLGTLFDNRYNDGCRNRKILWIELFKIRMIKTLFS
jgi:hypothetical protein